MGWTFKAHGALAYALGLTLLALTALTWLPAVALRIPPTALTWLTAAILALLIPTFLSAGIRAFLARADRHTTWQAFRCLPAKVQLALALAALAGATLLALTISGGGSLQNAREKNGHYYAFDTSPLTRHTVEISRTQYRAVRHDEGRTWLLLPGVLYVGAAYAVLTAGEVRRADRASKDA
ncbi:hypothetical protein ACWDO7_08865 [Streptomyces sp. NPDC003656]